MKCLTVCGTIYGTSRSSWFLISNSSIATTLVYCLQLKLITQYTKIKIVLNFFNFNLPRVVHVFSEKKELSVSAVLMLQGDRGSLAFKMRTSKALNAEIATL